MFKSCSPYLKIFSRKGINWHYALTSQLKKKAENEDKLIFLHIGYISNVIVRESAIKLFSDPQVKEFLNDNFISILEDKEDKPESFQLALDLLFINDDFSYGPANIFMTSDRKPLIAFSDCNPDRFIQIASSLLNAKYHKRDKLEELANALAEQTLHTGIAKNIISKETLLSDSLLKRYIHNWFDNMFNDGFLKEIKPFTPNPFSIYSIIDYLSFKPDNIYEGIIDDYLTHLQYSGIFDVVDGGFFRQAVDFDCTSVYYEKTLEENCNFLLLFAQSYSFFGNESYRETAYLVYSFITTELKAASGGLINSTTITGNYDTIDYYSFSINELKILFPDSYQLVCQSLGFDMSIDIMIKQFPKKGLETLRTIDAYSLSQLKKRRSEHRGYFRDCRSITSSNSNAVTCMAKASVLLRDDRILNTAIEIYDYLLLENIDKESGVLYRYSCSGNRYHKGYMSDYAYFIESGISLYEATHNNSYLNTSIDITKKVLQRFYKTENGMFSKSEINSEIDTVHFKRESNRDIIRPSANSIMAGNLLSLYKITKNKNYLSIAERQLKNISHDLLSSGPMLSGWANKIKIYIESGLNSISE